MMCFGEYLLLKVICILLMVYICEFLGVCIVLHNGILDIKMIVHFENNQL